MELQSVSHSVHDAIVSLIKVCHFILIPVMFVGCEMTSHRIMADLFVKWTTTFFRENDDTANLTYITISPTLDIYTFIYVFIYMYMGM